MRALCLSTIFSGLFAVTPALAADPFCMKGEFDPFIARYSREIAVQEAATADPVMFELLDMEAMASEELTAREMPLSEIAWPVMPELKSAEATGYVVEITAAAETASVLIRGADNGERVTWYFTRSPCWTLVRVRDDGM